jgi:hypothetical protein
MDLFGFDVTGVVTFIFQLVGVVFNFVFGLFLILSGYLVNVATEFNFNILSDSNAILKTGWLAARDIANLGFVILAIGSALATILRYPPEYDVRKLLPKFVAAAILVNFSMTLAAIPIQFSNVLTGFFLSRVTSVQNNAADAAASVFSIDIAGPLVNILGPQKLLVGETDPLPPDPGDSAGGALSAVLFASLATLIFNIIFTLLMAILLLAFAVMLISRYFILTFLIIFSPLACLFYIFPALKDKFSLWNSQYIKWVFIGPSMMFFVYMAIVVAEKLPSTALKGGGGIIMSGFGGVIEQFINLSFITAILVMGLIAAGKTGTGAGKMALGAANGIGNGAKKFFNNQVTKFASKDSPAGQFLQKQLKRASENLKVKEGDGTGTKILKRFGATSSYGQAVAAAGGHEKGVYGSLIQGALAGAGIKPEKEKKPENKKDVEKELDELTAKIVSMIKNGLDTKEVEEKIKASQRKLYRFHKEELEADYMQAPEKELDGAIKKADKGKQPSENVKDEKDIKLGLEENKLGDEELEKDITKVEEEAVKIVNQQKDLEKNLKLFTKGILEDEKNEKSEVKQTVSRNKLSDERELVGNKVKALRKLKKEVEGRKEKLSDKQEQALNILQSIEYVLNNELKKREEEIQNLGSIRRRRENAKTELKKALGETITESENKDSSEEDNA